MHGWCHGLCRNHANKKRNCTHVMFFKGLHAGANMMQVCALRTLYTCVHYVSSRVATRQHSCMYVYTQAGCSAEVIHVTYKRHYIYIYIYIHIYRYAHTFTHVLASRAHARHIPISSFAQCLLPNTGLSALHDVGELRVPSLTKVP
jgi:hypothetical protein